MKIFGYYIFEDSPELKAFKAERAKDKRKEMIDSCRYNGLVDISLVAWNFDQEGNVFRDHQRLAKNGECHEMYDKKYCYHKGREIITKT